MGLERGEKPHAVCLPAPAQGHITLMLEMAKLLHARGFHITFVNTEFNHRRLLRSRGTAALDGLPSFRFAAIPDGLPASDADATQDVPALCYAMMTTFLPRLRALLAKLNDPSSGVPPITCLVVDDEEQLTDNGYLDTPVDGMSGMCDGIRLRDFPTMIRTTDRDDTMLNYVMREAERLSLPDAVLLNTFDALEQPVLNAMRAILPPMYTVGPLHLHSSSGVPTGTPLDGLGSNLWKEQDGLLEWLDGHGAGAVVYVKSSTTEASL
ncbi:unnamed protein product [Triticum turgidum subsp. durum]|uniref:Glycosyltransferase n=1 Tax=Triticum turgidum subsp. durum TaxID=4567 RepID=A0A9R0QNI9_TRITD|nr:unnamed protein product [Triticum turgidum subsp. durum]